eukprot:5651944-Lingulodinium_polyedra.AAC.1
MRAGCPSPRRNVGPGWWPPSRPACGGTWTAEACSPHPAAIAARGALDLVHGCVKWIDDASRLHLCELLNAQPVLCMHRARLCRLP